MPVGSKRSMSDAERAYTQAFGRRLRKAIYDSGMTYVQLDRLTGISEGTIRDAVHGRHAMKLWNVARICAVLGIDANDLMGVRR